MKSWWSQGESNSRPPACKAGALPAELWPQFSFQGLVGLGGFEPPTSPLSGVRSNQLSYRPKFFPLTSKPARHLNLPAHLSVLLVAKLSHPWASLINPASTLHGLGVRREKAHPLFLNPSHPTELQTQILLIKNEE